VYDKSEQLLYTRDFQAWRGAEKFFPFAQAHRVIPGK
jgi:hypothetical protein